jgi:glutamyl-Q tRNA(Asp) synthetase
MGTASGYIGRFAPTPSGPLHFGSLIAAVGSYLQARCADGAWLLRIEDLDRPRCVAGADANIIATLAAYGFEWDGPIERQSRRLPLYRIALEKLLANRQAFYCTCSRSQIAAQIGDESEAEVRYPGTCRGVLSKPDAPHCVRFAVPDEPVRFHDRLRGPISELPTATCGDFPILRRDGIFSYHLAVVVDDAQQGITEVARGADLLGSTARQVVLQKALGLATPDYCHLPLALDTRHRKLSKSAQSIAIDTQNPVPVLWQALNFLELAVPPELQRSTLDELWNWAKANWQVDRLADIHHKTAP